jgi:hypothetical protein
MKRIILVKSSLGSCRAQTYFFLKQKLKENIDAKACHTMASSKRSFRKKKKMLEKMKIGYEERRSLHFTQNHFA